MAAEHTFLVGADENGLGARLGPLVVTAVLARVTEQGRRVLSRRPPKRFEGDLSDSKAVVSHGDVALGEAWARALVPDALDPAALFERVSLEGLGHLRTPCPAHVEAQCWSPGTESFVATAEEVDRVRGHLRWWNERGIDVLAVRTSITCTKRLNDVKAGGGNRFTADLHAMERLVLALREEAGTELTAVCGKVGGIEDYSRFFGPLSMRLHAVLEKKKALSAYRFPGLGELRFVRDADGRDALVMLASLVGKYVRELLMARVSRFYATPGEAVTTVSGYHDPVTARFVLATSLVRRDRAVPDGCFERARDER